MKGLYLEDLTFREFFDWLKEENIDLFELKELVLQQGRHKYASIDDWMEEVEQSIYTSPFLDFARSASTHEEIEDIHRDIFIFLRQDFTAYHLWGLYHGNNKMAIAELWQIPSISLSDLKNIYRAYMMMNILEDRGKLDKEYLNLFLVQK